MTPLLTLLFAATALLYAAVGFGGGSTYNALLVLGEVDYRLVPSIALMCNLIVVTGSLWRFWREDTLPFDVWRRFYWYPSQPPGSVAESPCKKLCLLVSSVAHCSFLGSDF
ncbi:MAG: hypothetical protein AAF829_08655 [Pseudomonadota bacterium]